jgi:hypothetical protein
MKAFVQEKNFIVKTTFKVIALCSFSALAFILPPHSLVGKWSIKESDGTRSYIDFTSAGKFSYTNQGKLIHHGNYTLKNDVFSVNDNECGDNYWATYKLTFVGDDSVSFAVVSDTCVGRSQTVNGGGLKKVNK